MVTISNKIQNKRLQKKLRDQTPGKEILIIMIKALPENPDSSPQPKKNFGVVSAK